MQLSPEELQYIVNAIDTHIRTNGLNVAIIGIGIVTKIQTEIETNKVSLDPEKD